MDLSDALNPKQAAGAAESFLLKGTQQDRVVLVVPADSESDKVDGFSTDENDSTSDGGTASRSSSDISLNSNNSNDSSDFNTNTNASRTVCHGRVKNPEAMVPETWWKTVFSDQLYLLTDGDVVEDPAITLEEVRILEGIDAVRNILQSSSISSGTTVKVLDLCCGQGRHVLQLAELYPSLELYGHDQSEFLIQLARSRAAAVIATATAASPKDAVPLTANTTASTTTNNNNNKGQSAGPIQFTIGDCRSVPFSNNTFDLILVMGNSFGYFSNDKDDEVVMQQIHRVLRPGGVVVLDIVDGAFQRENFNPRGWEWVDDEMMVCRERWLSEDRKRLVCREVIIKTGQGVIRDQFYQERLFDGMDMQHLLDGAGLKWLKQQTDGLGNNHATEQKQPDDLTVKTGEMSQRGEDLGLMEQRNFFVAVKSII
ncbi:hypothetical protein BGX24_003736 [Mortierella sp. AD032]|nr:hypothetical protein BGX24_003736 [Mortierella sp. AD032]